MWFIKVLEVLWQLPQNIVGFLVVTVLNAQRVEDYYLASGPGSWGVSLGSFIIFSNCGVSEFVYRHEHGHQKQSLILGPLYLIVIGLPSVIGNIIHRIVGGRWYYKQPWEAWANKLGHAVRGA